MTISSCLYPNRSVVREIPVVLAMTRRRGQRGDEGDGSEERERKVEEEGGDIKRRRTDQELLNVQSIINTSSQFAFLTKVIDPNLSSVSGR